MEAWAINVERSVAFVERSGAVEVVGDKSAGAVESLVAFSVPGLFSGLPGIVLFDVLEPVVWLEDELLKRRGICASSVANVLGMAGESSVCVVSASELAVVSDSAATGVGVLVAV